ncbi:MAG: amidohydrolase family protein [Clostridia bacterium]|nr:amidohydrolase family protein [Clostridia bacterium]
MTLRIRCRHLWDGTRDGWTTDVDLVIEEGRVVRIEACTGEADVDWTSGYVIPGLVDAHDHFCIDMGDGAPEAGEPPEWKVAKGLRTAALMLATGITYLRNAGEKDNVGRWVDRAIREGLSPGPDCVLSGVPITSTGGHGWFLAVETDGPDRFRRAVRTQIKQGAGMIKLIVTGGVTTPGGTLIRPCATPDEIRAAIEEAHANGVKVGAHAYGGPAATAAIISGVDSIEHGTYLSDEDLMEMSKRGTWLVCTSSVMTAAASDRTVAPFMRERFAQVAADYRSTIARARKFGVRVVVGCDTHHGHLADEAAFLVGAGYTVLEALKACTADAGAFLAGEPGLGRLAPGSRADAVLLRGDPLRDVAALKGVTAVMKRGHVWTVGLPGTPPVLPTGDGS